MLRLLLIGAVLTWVSALHADWVELVDGVKIRGRVILHTRREVTLKTEHGLLTFDMKRVRKVHFTEAPPKSEQQRREEAAKKAAEQAKLSASGDSQGRNRQTAARTLGPCVVNLPRTFSQTRGRTAVEGQNGTLLGVYTESSSGAVLTATETVKTPLNARSIDQLEAAIKASFQGRRGVQIHSFRRAKLDGRSALLGDLTTVASGKKTRNLQAWFFDDHAILYSIGISVLEPQYRLNPRRYEQILKSFRFASASPKPKAD